jgi:hypothetical protein
MGLYLMPLTGNPATAAEIEDAWRARLSEARAAYQMAVSQFRIAYRDLQRSAAASSDRTSGVQRAILVETRARAEYLRLLQMFTDTALSNLHADN